MVQVVCRSQSSNTHAILIREIDSKFWFLDHVLCSNVYPCQHLMQMQEETLMTLFQVVSG